MEAVKSTAETFHLQLRSTNIEKYSRNFTSPIKKWKQWKVQRKLSISNEGMEAVKSTAETFYHQFKDMKSEKYRRSFAASNKEWKQGKVQK